MKKSIKKSLLFAAMVANMVCQRGSAQDNTFPTTGNVGIGTTTPTSQLMVSRDSQGTASQLKLNTVGGVSNGNYSGIDFTQGSAGSTYMAAMRHYFDDNGRGALTFWTRDNTTGYPISEKMRLDRDGKLGIGTSSPQAKLHVASGSTYLVSNPNQPNTNNNVFSGHIFFNRFGNDSNPYAYIQAGNENRQVKAGFVFRTCPSTGYQDAMVISPNGDVGIGTTNPNGWKLAVNGKIRAKEIKVETGWSDYVFDDDYHLTPLEDVDDFIEANNHLPGFPSEKEIEEKEIGVGELMRLQQEKIEELTLYLIAQNKKIKELEVKIEVKDE
ncbi:hypothetical protein JYT51_02385 [Candidatus Amoebophilus asiaticus]|nr:hypothetical protein [Candidatus Amoebophilus asiaticus]